MLEKQARDALEHLNRSLPLCTFGQQVAATELATELVHPFFARLLMSFFNFERIDRDTFTRKQQVGTLDYRPYVRGRWERHDDFARAFFQTREGIG